jgi:CRP-like cAMP-binding protein
MDQSLFFDYPGLPDSERPEELVFLQGRSEEDWRKLRAHTTTLGFTPGQVFIREGETDRALYLIIEGTLEILSPHGSGGKLTRIGTVEAGSVIGEQAFLDGKPRSMTIRAITEGKALRLSCEAFEVLAARDPQLGLAILFDLGRIVSLRLRQARGFISAFVG